MKMTIALAALGLMVSSMAFAQGAGTAAAEPAKKMSKKEAKATCKTEGKKGKELKECIKEKTM